MVSVVTVAIVTFKDGKLKDGKLVHEHIYWLPDGHTELVSRAELLLCLDELILKSQINSRTRNRRLE